tara:strand:- start:398 stop:520 length:123 start_codon:yes stop_codon:yes gene_type:complete
MKDEICSVNECYKKAQLMLNTLPFCVKHYVKATEKEIKNG